MGHVKEGYRYTKEHEWAAAVEGNRVRIGITDYAQCELGDIVFVELPQMDAVVSAGQGIGTIESVKTVSDLYSPVAGTVKRVNEELLDRPELMNESPYEDGWIVEMEVEGDVQEMLGKLLTPEQYQGMTD